jgi:hypothetical protein
MSTRREVIGILGSGKEEHRALVEPLARVCIFLLSVLRQEPPASG